MSWHIDRISRGLLVLALAAPSFGYSVLSHEAVIDALWKISLAPALRARFPQATPEQLKQAHAYAYGGAIIQDMGYYPHGNGYFSDLTHYVRSGDFIKALISNSQTLDEYAFALGALSHYASDNDGHRLATNVGEPMLYPKVRRKFGTVVTYEDQPDAHLQTEYGFDIEEVAQGDFASQAYHDFIGFNVAKPLLEKAFHETYGFELSEMFNSFDQAIGSYRHTLSTLIPFITRVAWAAHENDIRKARPGITRRQFLYVMRRSSYEREWGRQYDHPSLGDRLLAFLIKILPPIGDLKVLRFKTVTPPVEQLFESSFDVATKQYGEEIRAAGNGSLRLENTNFDLGVITKPGDYKLQDETYAYWLDQLAKHNFAAIQPVIADNLLKYYSNPNARIDTKTHPKDWQRLLSELGQLKSVRAASANGS